MAQSNFIFLQSEYPILYNIGLAAEYNLHKDSITALFKLRQLGERISELLFDEHHLDFPYDNSFNNRIKTLEFENILPKTVADIFFLIKDKGNIAVHKNKGSVDDAKKAHEQIARLAGNLSHLNTIYGNMLSAMQGR